jgi:hypothetical protein
MSSKTKVAEQGYKILKGAVIATLVVAAIHTFTTDWNGLFGLSVYAWYFWGIIDVILAIGVSQKPKLFGNITGILGIAMAIVCFFLPVSLYSYYYVAIFAISAFEAFALARLAEAFE